MKKLHKQKLKKEYRQFEYNTPWYTGRSSTSKLLHISKNIIRAVLNKNELLQQQLELEYRVTYKLGSSSIG